MQQHEFRGRHNIPGIVPALAVIGIGVLFLLNNLNIVYVHDWWRYWPVILIAAGMAKMVDAEHSGGRLSGGILLCVGALFLADTLGFLRLSWHDFWPLILIGAGLVMLWSRLAPPPAGVPASPPGHEGVLNEYAIFGGVERKVMTDDFRGGHVSAMFGGVELDLRQASIRAESAVLDVNAMFGGIEIKVPTSWVVVPQVAAIFGGFSKKGAEPSTDMPGVRRLYIKGSAIFGGVDVKN